MPDYVWGRNPVLETLRSSRQVKRLLLADGQRDDGRYFGLAQGRQG